jgi:hypothetical protein
MAPIRKSLLCCVFLLVLAVIPSVQLFAWGNDSLVPAGQHYLEMRGRILKSQGQQRDEEKIPLDSAVVAVVNEGGKTIWAGLTDSKGRLNIRLPLGKKFTMSFTKKGFVKKLISIDTHIIGEAEKNFDFTYDIDIFEKVEGLDVTALDSPVAKIAYKAYDKSFVYDVAYTNKINAALQKMYRDYYTLKKREEELNASDSIATRPAAKSTVPRKSVPYGQEKKPH